MLKGKEHAESISAEVEVANRNEYHNPTKENFAKSNEVWRKMNEAATINLELRNKRENHLKETLVARQSALNQKEDEKLAQEFIDSVLKEKPNE